MRCLYMRRAYRPHTWSLAVILVAALGCGTALRSAPPPTDAQSSQAYVDSVHAAALARVRPWVGCYSLELGSWTLPDSTRPPRAEDVPAFTPPTIIQLDTVVENGQLRVLPRLAEGVGFDTGYWYVGPGDQLTVAWPKSGWYATTFSVGLVPAADDNVLQGRAAMRWHARSSAPYPARSARAQKVTCSSSDAPAT